MNRLLGISVLVSVLVSGLLIGCKKDDAIYAMMETIPVTDMGLEAFNAYYVCADGQGGIYTVQKIEQNGVATIGFHGAAGDWQTQELEFQSGIWNYNENLKMKATADGSVWLLGYLELFQFKNGILQRAYSLDQSNIPSPTYFNQLAVNGNSVWLMNRIHGLYSLNRSTGLLVRQEDPTDPNYYYNRMVIDSDNNIWISKEYHAENLIGLMSDGTWQSVADPDSLLVCTTCNEWLNTYKQFFLSAVDQQGVTYLSSGSNLYRIVDRTLELMFKPFIQGGTSRMFCDADNQLWMHSAIYPNSININPLVYRYEGNQDPSYFDVSRSFEGNVWIYDSTVDHNNNIWIATNKGVVIYNSEGVRI